MTTFVTLASKTSPTLMPLTRDPDGSLTAFVFSNADNAIAFGNSHLQHNDDEWITNTHDKGSLLGWLDSCANEDGVTQIAVDPSTGTPRVLPLMVFRGIVEKAP